MQPSTSTGRRRIRLWSVVAVSALALTACSRAGVPNLEASNSAELTGYLAQAQEAGASEVQIERLSAALDGDGLTFQDMVELNEATIQCLVDAGVDAFLLDPIETVPGVMMPQHGAYNGPGQTDEELLQLMHSCYFEYMAYAQMFYGRQPSSLEAQSADFAAARRGIVECLTGHGMVIGEHATDDEVYQAVFDDLERHSQQPGFEPCYRGASSDAP